MKVDSINNNAFFGNKKGGVKYLRIIKEGKNLRFIEATKETSDVGEFVAGGPEIDRKVDEANLKTMMRYHPNKPSCATHNSLWKGLRNILNF